MLEKIWYSRCSPWAWLLWPLSCAYRLVVWIKTTLYRVQILKSYYFNVPVIVVGNITVGGTGKTPFCIALCELLKKHGYKPGFVSRGYGGRATHWPQSVTPDSDPALVGDEPVLLARRTLCPMVVAPDRVAAVKQLLAEHDCNVVISDDGLQHYRMGRAIELVLLDQTRGVGNGWCLPAGPLREPVSRLKTVDLVIENGSERMHISPGEVVSLLNSDTKITPADVSHKTICAMAGIGNPQRFFDMLSKMGFHFTPKAFADHYAFTPSTLSECRADIIIMTEKDAVKCRSFADKRCYVLPIYASLSHEVAVTLCNELQKADFFDLSH